MPSLFWPLHRVPSDIRRDWSIDCIKTVTIAVVRLGWPRQTFLRWHSPLSFLSPFLRLAPALVVPNAKFMLFSVVYRKSEVHRECCCSKRQPLEDGGDLCKFAIFRAPWVSKACCFFLNLAVDIVLILLLVKSRMFEDNKASKNKKSSISQIN